MTDATTPGTRVVPWDEEDDSLQWLSEMEGADPTAMAAQAQSVAMQADTMFFANRGLRALAAVERDIATLKEATRRDVDAVVARWALHVGPLIARAEHLRIGLTSLWATGALRPPQGKKSVALESGTIGARKHGAKVVVTDTTALEVWAAHQTAVLFREVVTRKLDKKALDEYVLTTGDVPPGVEVVPEGEDVYVKAEPVEYAAPALPRAT
jgi:hypothetical protein